MSDEYGEYGFTRQHMEELVKLGVKFEHLFQRMERFELRMENRLTLVEQQIASKHDLEKTERELRADLQINRDQVKDLEDKVDDLSKSHWKLIGVCTGLAAIVSVAVKVFWH